MYLFLRLACVKCPRKTIFCVKRFYWTSHSFTFREGLGIRYFIPRTTDVRVGTQTERMKDQDSVPEEFKLIYNFSHEGFLATASYSALAFAMIFIYVLCNPKYFMALGEHKKEEENEPISEEPVLQDDYTPNVIIEKIKPLSGSLNENHFFYSGDPRAKSLVGLAMIIFFFYIRSRCVLKIYRHNNDYITVLHQALGFGKKEIEHKAKDCCYYPNRKWFNYNVMGKNVIIISELFVSHEERTLYFGRRSQ